MPFLLTITMLLYITISVLLVWVCISYQVWEKHNKHTYDTQMAHNTSTLGSVLAPGTSNGDSTVYALVNWVSTGSGNGLSPVRRQAITWTNGGLLSVGLLGTNFSEIRIRNFIIFIHENACEVAVCHNCGHFKLSKGGWGEGICALMFGIVVSNHIMQMDSFDENKYEEIPLWDRPLSQCVTKDFQIRMRIYSYACFHGSFDCNF